MRIGGEIQAFKREDAGAAPAAKRVLLGIDGTGVPKGSSEKMLALRKETGTHVADDRNGFDAVGGQFQCFATVSH